MNRRPKKPQPWDDHIPMQAPTRPQQPPPPPDSPETLQQVKNDEISLYIGKDDLRIFPRSVRMSTGIVTIMSEYLRGSFDTSEAKDEIGEWLLSIIELNLKGKRQKYSTNERYFDLITKHTIDTTPPDSELHRIATCLAYGIAVEHGELAFHHAHVLAQLKEIGVQEHEMNTVMKNLLQRFNEGYRSVMVFDTYVDLVKVIR